MSIAGVVLAAGASTRLGEPKQLLRDDTGETLVHRISRMLLDARCGPVFVVVGAAHEQVTAAVHDLVVQVVYNAEWSEGISSSIRAAVSAAELHQRQTGEVSGEQHGVHGAQPHTRTAIDALLFSTCDMPAVSVVHIQALCTAFVAGAARVASRYGETIGVPAIIGAAEWPLLETLRGDHGAKSLLLQPDTVAVPLAGGTFDVDTPADILAWHRKVN